MEHLQALATAALAGGSTMKSRGSVYVQEDVEASAQAHVVRRRARSELGEKEVDEEDKEDISLLRSPVKRLRKTVAAREAAEDDDYHSGLIIIEDSERFGSHSGIPRVTPAPSPLDEPEPVVASIPPQTPLTDPTPRRRTSPNALPLGDKRLLLAQPPSSPRTTATGSPLPHLLPHPSSPSLRPYMVGTAGMTAGHVLPTLSPSGKRLLSPQHPGLGSGSGSTAMASLLSLHAQQAHLLRSPPSANSSPAGSPLMKRHLPAAQAPASSPAAKKARPVAATQKASEHPRKVNKQNGPHTGQAKSARAGSAQRLPNVPSASALPPLPSSPVSQSSSASLSSLSSSTSSSSSSSSAAPFADEPEKLYAQISVSLHEQVVYWGQSKNKCDVGARIFVPTKHSLLNKRASCHLNPPAEKAGKGADQEKPSKTTTTSASENGAEEEKKATALLVLKRQTEAVAEYEVLFKQCINNKRLSNLTLLEVVVTLTLGAHSITQVAPLVTYTHSKAITRASCRLIWYPTGERDVISVDELLVKLAAYHRHHLESVMQPSEKKYYQLKLANHKNVINHEEFYSVLGEWFVLGIKLAKKKKQFLWQQGEKSFIPLLINPAKEDSTILKEPGDFLIHIGEELKVKKGSNSLPALLYPLQITYVSADGQVDCMGVESKLDKLNGFVHEKRCLSHYLVLGLDGEWVRIKKEDFAFNAAQQRRWETSGGESCVIGRGEGECASYAHAS